VPNLVCPAAPEGMTPLHPPGFRYLILCPEHGYPIAEPEYQVLGLLGVVLDLASLPKEGEGSSDAARFIKVSAMLSHL
jgi:hypothetical protein